jgi:hypothetical protein
MSSVESAPKGILKSAGSKAVASEKRVRFDDTVEGHSMRKPVQVLSLVRGRFNGLLPEYFEEEDIGNATTLKAEVSDDTEPHKKFSHNTDVCIVFISKNLSLSWFDAESYTNLEKLRAKPNLKIIPIEVELKSSPSVYMREIISAVKRAYAKKDETPAITLLKEECANNVWVILDEWGTDLNEPLKRASFRDLIKLYVVIDNENPETILSYYESYKEKLNELNEYFKEKKRHHFYFEDFVNIIQFSMFVSNLESEVNEEKNRGWKRFFADVKQHYPKQLGQQASGAVAEDSKMMEEIDDTAFVTTLVGVSDEEMGDAGEEPNKISSSTPFWSVPLAQPAQIAENTAAECAGLTI